jgi:hypothetical protein
VLATHFVVCHHRSIWIVGRGQENHFGLVLLHCLPVLITPVLEDKFSSRYMLTGALNHDNQSHLLLTVLPDTERAQLSFMHGIERPRTWVLNDQRTSNSAQWTGCTIKATKREWHRLLDSTTIPEKLKLCVEGGRKSGHSSALSASTRPAVQSGLETPF